MTICRYCIWLFVGLVISRSPQLLIDWCLLGWLMSSFECCGGHIEPYTVKPNWYYKWISLKQYQRKTECICLWKHQICYSMLFKIPLTCNKIMFCFLFCFLFVWNIKKQYITKYFSKRFFSNNSCGSKQVVRKPVMNLCDLSAARQELLKNRGVVKLNCYKFNDIHVLCYKFNDILWRCLLVWANGRQVRQLRCYMWTFSIWLSIGGLELAYTGSQTYGVLCPMISYTHIMICSSLKQCQAFLVVGISSFVIYVFSLSLQV